MESQHMEGRRSPIWVKNCKASLEDLNLLWHWAIVHNKILILPWLALCTSFDQINSSLKLTHSSHSTGGKTQVFSHLMPGSTTQSGWKHLRLAEWLTFMSLLQFDCLVFPLIPYHVIQLNSTNIFGPPFLGKKVSLEQTKKLLEDLRVW